MEVVPVINCPDIACVRETLASAKGFLPEGAFLHLDVTDGVFASHETWGDPAAWPEVQAAAGTKFALEVHLMVAHPRDYAGQWIRAGARRLIVHAEAIADQNTLKEILQKCAEGGSDAAGKTELMLSSRPETPVESFAALIPRFSQFQVLAVHPGPSAQAFLPEAVEKIKKLRATAGPDAIIEVDGGMDLRTAKLVRDAGANQIVSDHFIFQAVDPKSAYESLKNI